MVQERTPKIPGPDHPISITADAQHIVVSVAGRVIAEIAPDISQRVRTHSLAIL